MVNFADCVSKVQCRNLVTNTPTKNGIKTVLEKAASNGNRLDSFSEAINVAVQNRAMYSMGAKEKRMNWVQKFIKKGLLPNDKPFATEILDSKFEPCGIPVGTKEMFNSFMGKSQAPNLLTKDSKVLAKNIENIAKAVGEPIDTFLKAVKK